MTDPDDLGNGRRWLDEIYEIHGSEIFEFCRQVTGDQGVAEEITRDVFVRAWRARAQFDDRRGSLRDWLFRIAHNASNDAHRAAADPSELPKAGPPTDLIDRIHAATGPAPASTPRRLSPSWLGRWTPAVAAAVLVVAVMIASVWPSSSDEFTEFELAAQNGVAVSADFRFDETGDGTTFDVRATGLEVVKYDVWVRTTEDGKRHWIGAFVGDTDGAVSFVADFRMAEIERLWATDPGGQPILGYDFHQ